MLYKKCPRCKIKFKRTRMVKQKISYAGGKLKVKSWFCVNHLKEKTLVGALWADSIGKLVPDFSVFK